MIKDIVQLEVSKEERLSCLEKALNYTLNNKFIDNLRIRSPIVRLDSTVRGYIGEIGLGKWFAENKIDISKTNILEDDDSMDIDFIFKTGNKSYSLEAKTSLIPDNWGSIDRCLEIADIKVIKRTGTIDDLKGDFHLQIYFNKHTNERDNFLNSLNLELSGNHEHIYEKMELDDYELFFVAWVDKERLIRYIKNLLSKGEKGTWKFYRSMKFFWRCPINEIGKEPSSLINELHKLNN